MNNWNRIILNESKASDLHERLYPDMDWETFEKICALDTRNTKYNNGVLQTVGRIAQSFLLPAYANGEKDLLEDPELVKRSLETFQDHIREFPAILRNITNFHSVADLVKFIADPENFDMSNYQAGTATPDKANNQASIEANKDDKLTFIYKKYYQNDIPNREDFDKLVALDPTSTSDKIGNFASKLLLPCFASGETAILSDKSMQKKFKLALQIFTANLNKDIYDENEKNLESYKTIDEFISFILDATTPSNLINRLNAAHCVLNTDYRILASTYDYDIVSPITKKASVVIASKGYDGGADAMVWCTGSPSLHYWENKYSPQYGILVEFMRRGHDVGNNNRENNWQAFIRNNRIEEFRNGYNNTYPQNTNTWNVHQYGFIVFLQQHPDIYYAIKDLPEFRNLREIAEVAISAEYDGGPIIITDAASLNDFLKWQYSYANLIEEIQISNIDIPALLCKDFIKLEKATIGPNVKIIGAGAFLNCTALINVIIKDGVVRIGKKAFYGDSNLKTVDLPASIETIEKNAFSPESRNSVTIPRARLNDTKLHLDSADKNWYMSHLKVR